MSTIDSREKCPQDIVAIFHASFHPTQGNVVDWSLKASDDLNLDNVEFSALPSGLHLVEEDVVYFTKDGQHGVCVFRRRKTVEQGHRGFRLSSLGVLLAKSRRPRPWRHTAGLKDLIARVYAQAEQSSGRRLQPTERDWDHARAFFEERKIRRADLGGAGDWNGWGHELHEIETVPPSANPTLHLPHLLRILGPSSMTLYKHVLGRQRILIYTLPPVEAACMLCQVAADMCYEMQHDPSAGSTFSQPRNSRLRGRCKEPINVLGMVTLNDLDRLLSEGRNGRGWIACTTDAIFLERPSYYDLLIDLTTSTPNKATRPTFHTSKPVPSQPGRPQTYRLSTIRFAWSDIKLWNELDRILHLDSEHSSHHHGCCEPPAAGDPPLKSKLVTTWTDAWRVYEDVCVVCAGLWMGSWRNNSTMSYSTAGGAENWGRVRLEGDDDLSLSGGSVYVRSLGMGIEGGPIAEGSGGKGGVSATLVLPPPPPTPTNRAMRRSSGMSWSSGNGTVVSGSGSGSGNKKARHVSSSTAVGSDDADLDDDDDDNDDNDDGERRRDRQLLTTLSLLQTFHAHTSFQLSILESFLPPPGAEPGTVVYLAPKDILAFELGPFSGFDARYLEWLAREYAGTARVVVRRGWKDLLSAIFGYG